MSAMLACLGLSCSPDRPQTELLPTYQENAAYQPLEIQYPLNGTLYPPDLGLTTFSWKDASPQVNAWIVWLRFSDASQDRSWLATQPNWTPTPAEWEEIKKLATAQEARVVLLGFQRSQPKQILSCGKATFRTSTDPVGAPIFYREVNLPFLEAVKDPSRIRWRFGDIASTQPPPIVLEGLPVCGNCHSFSQDGKTLGLDVDYANNKAAYAIVPVSPQMELASSGILSWNDYRREDGQPTFGLLSQVSPDGQWVVSTVKDRSVFVATPGIAFSQLFFPIQGILALYDRRTGKFASLPGADDPEYVQSNPTWSPDGQWIVFARAKRYELKAGNVGTKVLLSLEDCAEFINGEKTFQFDLWRMPFNKGKGGKPEPLKGASGNGRSNFFAKYSPDGRWIIFCQAKSFMLLQPDSELFIIPAEGGEARRLEANTRRMNSWHSWSPNGKWLVFSSKAATDYTQLHLTHIDAEGHSTPAVQLAHFTAPDRAANIPEFVNARPEAIARISPKFLDDDSHARAAYTLENAGDFDRAIAEYQKALEINPRNPHAHQRLGFLLFNVRRQFPEGLSHTMEALKLDPKDGCAHYDLGMAMFHQKQLDGAVEHLTQAVQLLPTGFDARYNPGDMRYALATVWLAKQNLPEAAKVLRQAIEFSPKKADFRYSLALVLAAQGEIDEPAKQYAAGFALAPEMDTEPQYHNLISINYANAGQASAAVAAATRGLALAKKTGNAELARELQERLAAWQAAPAAH